MTDPAPIRILVVERSEDAAAGLCQLLSQRFGARMALAGRVSVSGALALVREQGVDMVIANTVLADGGGLDLCRALRTDARFADLPVMLLADQAPPSEKIAGFLSGADDFIVRPIDERLFAARIELLWRIKRMSSLH